MNTNATDIEPNATVIDNAIRQGCSFAMALLPGSNHTYSFGIPCDNHESASLNEECAESLEVIPWLGKYNERCIFTSVGIINRSALGSIECIPSESTTPQAYYHAARTAIARCKKRNGKTVISRVICGKFDNDKESIGNIAVSLFREYPDTFRFIYYTPETGGWLAATPETLADIDMKAKRVSSMAFAGTRKTGTSVQWDEKNRKENTFVLDYIVNRLRTLGLTSEVTDGENVAFGNIEHLCRHISAKFDTNVTVADIIDALNPTPALCGMPVNDAIHDIATLEAHPRGCYGGVVALSTGSRYRAFVNLRCMQFGNDAYCIYGGGGITSDSDVETEFLETEAKTAFLQSLVKPR